MKNRGAIGGVVLAKLIRGAQKKVGVNGDSVAFMNDRRFTQDAREHQFIAFHTAGVIWIESRGLCARHEAHGHRRRAAVSFQRTVRVCCETAKLSIGLVTSLSRQAGLQRRSPLSWGSQLDSDYGRHVRGGRHQLAGPGRAAGRSPPPRTHKYGKVSKSPATISHREGPNAHRSLSAGRMGSWDLTAAASVRNNTPRHVEKGRNTRSCREEHSCLQPHG